MSASATQGGHNNFVQPAYRACVSDCYGRPMWGALYFCPVVSFYLSIFFFFFFSSPNLSGHRLDVYHTSTHGVALARI